jgi:hypothetical protein
MKPYVPQPGTIPHRVISHLKTMPPGTELSSAVLADAISQPRGIIASCLNAPRKHGALSSRMKNGLMVWRLGNGVPEPMPPDYEPDEPLVTKSAGKPNPAPQPSAWRADQAAATFGIYSDGTFCVQRGTEAIWLDPMETKKLAEFIAKNHTQQNCCSRINTRELPRFNSTKP